MSLIQHNNFNQPNLNGLVDINSDNITTNSISTGEIIINGENIVDDVLDNKRKLTKIDYDDVEDVTEIDSGLTVSDVLKIGNITHTPGTNYIIENTTATGSLVIRNKDINSVIRTLTIDQFINVNGINDLRINKLFVGGNQINFNAYNDAVTKTTKIAYDSGTDTTNLNSKFTVSGETNFNGIVNLKSNLYQYQTTFLYKNLIFTTSNVKLLVLGGLEITQDELSYLSGLSSNIQSELNLKSPLNSPVFTGTININGIFNTNSNAFFNSTSTFYSEINLYNDLKFLGSSKIVLNSDLNMVNSSSVGFVFSPSSNLDQTNRYVANDEVLISTQTPNNSSLILTTNNTNLEYGIRINSSSSTSATITTKVDGNSIVVNQTNINVNGQINFSGSPTFLASSIFYDSISLPSVVATKNKINQNIISGDVSGNPNFLKYTSVRYNSNSPSGNSNYCFDVMDTYNNNQLWLQPNVSAGAYNQIVQANDKCILAISPSQNIQGICITTWNQKKNGLRISSTSSTDCTTEFHADLNNVKINSITGVSMNGVNSVTYSGGKTVDGNYGNIYAAVTLVNTTLTNGVDANVSGSGLSIPAGTYSISWVCTYHTLLSGGNIFGYGATYSTNPGYNTSLQVRGYSGANIGGGQYWSVTGTDYVVFNSSTTIYLRCYCIFGTSGTVEFDSSRSQLKCIKLC
jgi:hypothetical protein